LIDLNYFFFISLSLIILLSDCIEINIEKN